MVRDWPHRVCLLELPPPFWIRWGRKSKVTRKLRMELGYRANALPVQLLIVNSASQSVKIRGKCRRLMETKLIRAPMHYSRIRITWYWHSISSSPVSKKEQLVRISVLQSQAVWLWLANLYSASKQMVTNKLRNLSCDSPLSWKLLCQNIFKKWLLEGTQWSGHSPSAKNQILVVYSSNSTQHY